MDHLFESGLTLDEVIRAHCSNIFTQFFQSQWLAFLKTFESLITTDVSGDLSRRSWTNLTSGYIFQIHERNC